MALDKKAIGLSALRGSIDGYLIDFRINELGYASVLVKKAREGLFGCKKPLIPSHYYLIALIFLTSKLIKIPKQPTTANE